MQILFLSQRFLLPMDTGGSIRTGNILRELSSRHRITVVSNVESPRDDRLIAEFEGRYCTRFVPVPWHPVKRWTAWFFIRLAFQMLSRYPVSVLNDYSRPLARAVEREAAGGQYDLAICDFVQSALAFRHVGKVPTLLFQHNVESIIPRRHAEHARNPIARLVWWLQWRRMQRFEARMLDRFDHVVSVSDNDTELFRELYGATAVTTIPTGVDIGHFRPVPDADVGGRGIVFCGSMDWLPNEDAMVFFIESVLPMVRERCPDVRLTVVGRRPSPRLCALASGRDDIDLTGWVEDTRPYLARSAAVVVPIRIGGGTRMKIYEAMAMGKAVVSSTIGAEGLPVHDGEDILIADDPGATAEAVCTVLTDAACRHRIGAAGRALVEANFSWARVADVFESVCAATAAGPEPVARRVS